MMHKDLSEVFKSNKLTGLRAFYRAHYNEDYRQYLLAELLEISPRKLSTLLNSNLTNEELSERLSGAEWERLKEVYESALSHNPFPL